MNRLTLTLAAAVAAAGPALAPAQEDYVETPADTSYAPTFDNRWYVSPFVSYTLVDDTRGTNDGWGGGVAGGKPLNKWLNLELRTMYSQLVRSEGQGDFDVWDIGADALVFFRREGLQPFLLGGIGTAYDDFKCRSFIIEAGECTAEGNHWSFMANAGAGVLYPINDRLLVRADARYRYDTNQGNFNDSDNFGDWVFSLGVQIPFGSLARPVTRTYSLSADALFDFDQSTLRPAGRASIDRLSSDLAAVSYERVDVTGHTDPLGSVEYNQGLSERRAMTVSDELVNNGVSSDRIDATGAGESQLKVTEAECAGATSRAALIECLQPNRRVDVSVYGVTPK